MPRHAADAPNFHASVLAAALVTNSEWSIHEAAVRAHHAVAFARQLRKAFERQCNGYADHKGNWDQRAADRDDRRIARLESQLVNQLPLPLQAKLTIQRDPRGAAASLDVPTRNGSSSMLYLV